ncbi:2-oxoglutarate ferredoxin oxidoreductase subunit alpha, partial [Streptomyces sp. NPDC003283]
MYEPTGTRRNTRALSAAAPTGADTRMSVETIVPSATGTSTPPAKETRRVDRVVIRFAGDSGDGMQLTGDRFTSETAS